ncbi:MAG TPA: DUF1850 domain-containing protein [Calidithermus sp.]|nr:DUF1850 domain-containing protein [Calidithermus sp.]
MPRHGARALAGLALVLAAGAPWSAGADTCEELPRTLVVEDVSRGQVLHREPVNPGDRLALAWVHSSERVPVRGILVVEAQGGLRVVETAFAGPGPGLPEYRGEQPWRYQDGLIVAPGGDVLPELRLRVSPVARQRLTLPSGRQLDLAEAVPAGAAVRIAVE